MTADANPALVMGPVLFNWSADRLTDFYARIADEADVDRVHVGEVVCSKREPFFADRLPEAIERLTAAGKTVVVDALALPTLKRERQLVKDLAGLDGVEFEINDMSPLVHLGPGRRFAVSPLVNVYDEGTLGFLARRGVVGRPALRVALRLDRGARGGRRTARRRDPGPRVRATTARHLRALLPCPHPRARQGQLPVRLQQGPRRARGRHARRRGLPRDQRRADHVARLHGGGSTRSTV